MGHSPAASARAIVPYWTMIAVAGLYFPVTLAAEALIDPSAAGTVRSLSPIADVGGTPAAAVVAGAGWLLTAGGFLAAFRAELRSVRRRTGWRPPDKGYIVVAAGALSAHPLTGVPFVFLVVAGYALHRGLRVR